MNQSKTELEQNAFTWGVAWESICERITIGSGFTSDWMKMWRQVVIQNQGKIEVSSLFFSRAIPILSRFQDVGETMVYLV